MTLGRDVTKFLGREGGASQRSSQMLAGERGELPPPVKSPGWAPGGAKMIPLGHLQAILAAIPAHIREEHAALPLHVFPNPKGELMVVVDRGEAVYPRGVVIGNINLLEGTFHPWHAPRSS